LPLIRGEAVAENDEPRVTAMRYNKKKYFRPWKEQRGDINVVVRRGKWKGILNVEPRTFELYDLESDPREQHDLSSSYQEIRDSLREVAVAKYAESVTARAESLASDPGSLDTTTAAALRSLGYLEDEPEPRRDQPLEQALP
jgi:arylsulfatase A-like enzyme